MIINGQNNGGRVFIGLFLCQGMAYLNGIEGIITIVSIEKIKKLSFILVYS